MAKEAENAARFIELRGQGLSYQKISAELGVSKTSLIIWDQKYRKEIAEAQALELQAILDTCQVTRMQRVSTYARLMQRVQKEIIAKLESASLALPADRLLFLALQTERRLEREILDNAIAYEIPSRGFQFGDDGLLKID